MNATALGNQFFENSNIQMEMAKLTTATTPLKYWPKKNITVLSTSFCTLKCCKTVGPQSLKCKLHIYEKQIVQTVMIFNFAAP